MATATSRKAKVPQAAAAPKTAPEQTEQDAADRAWTELVDRTTAGDSPAARQIQRAIDLEGDRAKLMKKISDNREYLRLMDRNDELNEDEADFLDTFYPEKERGSRREKSDIEATRKAREAARKGNGSA
jgi:hypothetical protein